MFLLQRRSLLLCKGRQIFHIVLMAELYVPIEEQATKRGAGFKKRASRGPNAV